MRQFDRDHYIIGVDVGGTKIAAGLVTHDAQVLSRITLPTPDSENVDIIMNQIYVSVEEILKTIGGDRSVVTGIGLVAPGPMDLRTGIIFRAPNISAFDNTPILSLVQNRFEIPTLADNDANAAGLAESLFGAGVGYDVVLYVTVSTGIGTGLVINQQIFHGKHGSAGEGGHITIDYQGQLCGCGQRGCIEAYASGTSLTRRALERLRADSSSSKIMELATGNLEQVTPILVSQAAQRGDELAIILIRDTGKYLAIWLGGMVNLLDPDIIIIGGGLSFIGDLLLNTVRSEIPNHTLNPFIDRIRIVPARLDSDVGILGAAALHMRPGTK